MLLSNKVMLFHSYFTKISIYDCHTFFKRLVDLKNNELKFEILPKTNEEIISVSYVCIRFINS